jgi:hypothetical protein
MWTTLKAMSKNYFKGITVEYKHGEYVRISIDQVEAELEMHAL